MFLSLFVFIFSVFKVGFVQGMKQNIISYSNAEMGVSEMNLRREVVLPSCYSNAIALLSAEISGHFSTRPCLMGQLLLP